MWFKRLVVALCFVSLTGFVPASAENIPSFEHIDCSTVVALPAPFQCGYLTVPVDHSHPDGETLRLMVAIYPAQGADIQPDPIIYLSGGPGGGSVDSAIRTMLTFNTFRGRDVIFFDQRGTGFSEPDMKCPEYSDAFYANVDQPLTPDEQAALTLQAMRACHDRLVAEGINPMLFNSAASASDVDDLRVALGYDQVNLYGVSYGTRLALTVMRDHPDGIRSVILDSVYPPNVDGINYQTIDKAGIFDQLFDTCAADENCNQKYPDLRDVFYEVVDQFNANPVTVKSNPYTYRVDGFTLMNALFNSLYNNSLFPEVPHLIYQLRDGKVAGLSSSAPGDFAVSGAEYGHELFGTVPGRISLHPRAGRTCRRERPAASDAAVDESGLHRNGGVVRPVGSGDCRPARKRGGGQRHSHHPVFRPVRPDHAAP